MNDRTNDDPPTETHRRAQENEDPAPIVPPKREGSVSDASGKALDERDDSSPLDGAMEG